MNTKPLAIVPNELRLEEVLRQIVERLVGDDWEKRTTADGPSFFVIGREAFVDCEARGGLSRIDYAEGVGDPFTSQKRALRKRLSGHIGLPLQSARRAALRAGLSAATLDRLEATCRVRGPETFTEADLAGLSREGEKLTWPQLYGRVRAFSDFLDLIGGDARHPEHRLADGDIAKILLEEFAKRLPKMVARAAKLSELQFEDSRLEEASRCYLSGFYNAAAVLAVSALEGALRTALGVAANERRDLDDLISGAFRQGSLGDGNGGQPLAAAAHEARRIRNKVAHGGEVDPNESEEVLDRVRHVLEHLRGVG